MKALPLLFVLAVLASAQDVLTNDAIVKMVKSGLGEDLVVSMVKNQPGQYSLNPDELVKLKEGGVSEKILAAMVSKGSGTADAHASGATPAAGTVAVGDPNDPMTPHDSGIYLYAKDRNGEYKLIVLEQAAYQGSKTGGMLGMAFTYGIKKAKMKAVIPGQHASIRSPESEPVFYFYFEEKAAGLGKGGFGAAAISNPNQFAVFVYRAGNQPREELPRLLRRGVSIWLTLSMENALGS